MVRIETTILSNLIYNEDYCRKVVPFIKTEYFADRKEAIIAKMLVEFFEKYNKTASPEIVAIEISNIHGLSDKEVPEYIEFAKQLTHDEKNQEWLLEETEAFCKRRAVYNAILGSIKIIEGNDTNKNQDSIPSILSDALAVSFDTRVGHDYIDDSDSRFDFYHKVEDKVPFDLEMMNRITKGGLSKKTLNVILASTGVGKSLFMCHMASAALMQGRNVLYITMEMAEERIAERIDANLFNVTMDELYAIDKETFNNKISKLAKKTHGKLVIKEYPTSSAHSSHFRALIEELKTKKDFVPEIIMIDYLNICASAKMKMGASINSYTFIKSIAEELRALAVEYNLPIVTATQSNRDAFNNSDVDLNNTSESFGLPMTVDFMIALISTEELEALGQLMVKQLKNRYNDVNYYKRFIIGVDRSKMKLYDVEASAQEGISDRGQSDKPSFDNSNFGKRDNKENFKW